jgi:hypothetical protein
MGVDDPLRPDDTPRVETEAEAFVDPEPVAVRAIPCGGDTESRSDDAPAPRSRSQWAETPTSIRSALEFRTHWSDSAPDGACSWRRTPIGILSSTPLRGEGPWSIRAAPADSSPYTIPASPADPKEPTAPSVWLDLRSGVLRWRDRHRACPVETPRKADGRRCDLPGQNWPVHCTVTIEVKGRTRPPCPPRERQSGGWGR